MRREDRLEPVFFLLLMVTRCKEDSFRSFTYEEELERAKQFKQNLDEGNGWGEAHKGPEVAYWSKTFHEKEVPTKILFTFQMPMLAESFVQLLHPSNRKIRNQWDEAFKDHTTLEVYPDSGGYVTFMRAIASRPLKDRGFVLFIPPAKEVDWFGKQSLFVIEKNAFHPSKPENEGGLVRATNGGNFFVITPDDCKVLGLTNNNFNGWISKKYVEWLLPRVVPRSFNKLREDMIKGYRKYFENVQD